MDKNKIKSYLTSAFVNEVEEKAVGLKKTETIKSQNKKTNDEALKIKNKELDAYSKNLTANKEQNSKEVKKRELDKKEQEIHDNVEIAEGTLLNIDYDNPIDKKFAERFEKALAGDPTMGNSNQYANVVQDKVWGGDPNFGQSLVDKTKAMAKIQQNVVGGGNTMFPYGVKNGNYPVNENTDKNIKMKRLIFKKPFNGLDNALNLIPETYRVDDKQFEMTDGTETYKVRWEGTLTEGRAIVLNETNINVVNESIDKIKHLMGFKSEETLGNVRGKNRLDENKMFNDIWSKTKSLLTETEDIEGQDPNEGEFDDVDMAQAAEAKKDVEGNVPTEAKMNVQKPKEENWDVNVKGQAEEAKKHVHMNESYMNEEGEELKGPVSIFAQNLNKGFFQRIINNIDNNKQTFESAFKVMLKEMLEQNPKLATTSLKNDLKNIVITIIDEIIKSNENPQADLAQKQTKTPISEEEEMTEEKDRFDEIFEGLDEEEDEINENNDTLDFIKKNINKIESDPNVKNIAQKIAKDPKAMSELEMVLNKLNVGVNESLGINPEKIALAFISKSKSLNEFDAGGGFWAGLLGGGTLAHYIYSVPAVDSIVHGASSAAMGETMVGAILGATLGVIASYVYEKYKK